MLQKLYIKNFAIITELTIDWEDNLSVITGETGAGKSVLLGALNLILGDRADHAVILDKNEKCIVEAQFAVSKSATINAYLIQNEFEIYNEVIVRREISPTGRSRAFINDTPAKLEDLSFVGRLLVDMHRQFDNYELLQKNEQIGIIDNYLLLNEGRKNYSSTFKQLKALQKTLLHKKEEAKKATAEQDYLQFVYNELEELNLQGNEIEEWESKLRLLENAHQIKEQLVGAANQLINNEQSIIDELQIITKSLKNFDNVSPELDAVSSRLTSTIEELKDIATELEIQESNLSTDEEALSITTEKLQAANRLLLKHSVHTTADLIALRETFSDKLFTISTTETDISELEKQVVIMQKQTETEATKISKKRIEGIKTFSKEINKTLPELGFTHATFDVQHSFKEMNATGIDEIQFRFDANNTGHMQALQKAVSGGEMSRIMLIIKSLLAHNTEMPCMIFDEIDTGISGETALKVGKVLKRLAQKHQVISITHLPQIAAQAQHHLFVYKQAQDKKSAQQTYVRKLTHDERIAAIAEMLSGKQNSATALKAAEELLHSN